MHPFCINFYMLILRAEYNIFDTLLFYLSILKDKADAGGADMIYTHNNEDDKKSIYREIEYLKKKLNDMLVGKNFEIDKEVIYLSKRIDELLNEYSKLDEKDH